MTVDEIKRCLDSLPPEVRRQIHEHRALVHDYFARASHARERLAEQFPNMNPRLRAVISLAVARIL